MCYHIKGIYYQTKELKKLFHLSGISLGLKHIQASFPSKNQFSGQILAIFLVKRPNFGSHYFTSASNSDFHFILFFYHNGPNITNQSFALPKERVKAKLQRFEKSGQNCHVRYAKCVMSVTLHFVLWKKNAILNCSKRELYN